MLRGWVGVFLIFGFWRGEWLVGVGFEALRVGLRSARGLDGLWGLGFRFFKGGFFDVF